MPPPPKYAPAHVPIYKQFFQPGHAPHIASSLQRPAMTCQD